MLYSYESDDDDDSFSEEIEEKLDMSKASVLRSDNDRFLDKFPIKKFKKRYPNNLSNRDVMTDEKIEELQGYFLKYCHKPITSTTDIEEDKKQEQQQDEDPFFVNNDDDDDKGKEKEEKQKEQKNIRGQLLSKIRKLLYKISSKDGLKDSYNGIYSNMFENDILNLYKWNMFDFIENIFNPVNYQIFSLYYDDKTMMDYNNINEQRKNLYIKSLIRSHNGILYLLDDKKVKSNAIDITLISFIEKTEKILSSKMNSLHLREINIRKTRRPCVIITFAWKEPCEFELLFVFLIDTNIIHNMYLKSDRKKKPSSPKKINMIFTRDEMINTSSQNKPVNVLKGHDIYYINYGYKLLEK
jgi:hypothetical protein